MAAVDLGEFVVGAGQADLESFDFAEPSFAVGLGDPGDEVVADLCDSLPLGGVWPVHRAAHAGVLVDAGGGVGAAAEAGGDLATLEAPEELLPFLVGGCAVFLTGPQASAAGQEGQVSLDGLLGVDGLWPSVTLMSRCPAMIWAMCGGRPLRKLVESIVTRLLSVSDRSRGRVCYSPCL